MTTSCPVVLHDLEQDLDRFLAVVLGVGVPVQVIGLVDEQHAAHGPVQDLLGLGRGLPDVLPHQVVAHGVDQLALLQVAELVQQVAIRRATVVLPVPGAPVKHMCRLGRAASSPKQRRSRSTSSSEAISSVFFLHRDQADQVPVQGRQDVVNAGVLAFFGQGHDGVGEQGGLAVGAPPGWSAARASGAVRTGRGTAAGAGAARAGTGSTGAGRRRGPGQAKHRARGRGTAQAAARAPGRGWPNQRLRTRAMAANADDDRTDGRGSGT